MDSKNLKVISLGGAHKKIIELLAGQGPGSVLDCPCGSGIVSLQLVERGFEASCCDIDREQFQVKDDLDLKVANLNSDSLPYADEQFDYVVCSNGLHRLSNIENAVGEFSRILKPGGKAYLSWPNYGALTRRIKFLMTGSVGRSIDAPQFDQVSSAPEANFRFPLTLARVEKALDTSELKIHRVEYDHRSLADILAIPLALLIVFSHHLYALFSGQSRNGLGNSLSVLLAGQTIILEVQKTSS